MTSALVLGNGRSLKGFDFKSIPKNIDTIGCGLAFRYWQEINWYPHIYVNVDTIVCEQNKSILEFIKQKKCKLYIISKSITNIWHDYPQDGSIMFFEDIKKAPNLSISKINHWGSGNIAVYIALDICDNVYIAGFDCDYVEMIPECKQLDNGTLIIDKTPDYNPNYFFDSYQRKGDIYNVPNGKAVHLNSWIELSNNLPSNKKLINFNDKKTLYHLFESYPLINLKESFSNVMIYINKNNLSEIE